MYLNILLQTKSHDILNRYVLILNNADQFLCVFTVSILSFIYARLLVSPYRFIRVGGYKLLNAWLTYSKTTTNTPLLQLILLTLQKLPLTVDHLKQVCLDSSISYAYQCFNALIQLLIICFLKF